MVLNLIGIGLNDAKDITIRGLEAVKRCGSTTPNPPETHPARVQTSILIPNHQATIAGSGGQHAHDQARSGSFAKEGGNRIVLPFYFNSDADNLLPK